SPVIKQLVIERGVTSVQLSVKLAEIAHDIAPAIINGKQVDPVLNKIGFYKRKDSESGSFFTAEDVARVAGWTSLASRVPSARLEYSDGHAAIVQMRTADGVHFCTPQVFVDGTRIAWAASEGFDNIVNPGDIRAIEVYTRNTRIPPTLAARFADFPFQTFDKALPTRKGGGQSGMAPSNSALACGVIIIWTNRFDGFGY
ncbi:MAG TPA: hypothetical protein VF042_03955, partial [Gemmatimonadaceae bacterium]